MRMPGLLITIACAAFLWGCSSTVPRELVDARQAFLQASNGTAVELAPVELHKAQVALDSAESSFKEESDSYVTRDLAYVAQRKAEMAEAQAIIAGAKNSAAKSDKDYEVTQGNMLQENKKDLQKKQEDLAQTSAKLAAAEQSKNAAAVQLLAEKNARLAAEKRTSDAVAQLAKLAAIREDQRGLILTLSGSVLFRSNESTLLPGAESKLAQVVDALSTMDKPNLLVEGFTDSMGSDQYNRDLAQRRADTVRNFLVSRSYPSELVRTSGVGEGRPIADNATAEGRANNRRVEIVIQKKTNP